MSGRASGFGDGGSASSFDGLSADQQERLAALLDRYLSALENGTPLDVDDLTAAHPDLAEPLRRYLDRLDELHHVSATFADRDRPVAEEPEEGDETKRLGDFRLGDEIGRGGMGVVYEAWQISLDRKVALKVLPFAAVLDPRQITRFKNEAKAAAQLQHPHIVPVYAVGSERGVHYYAMQYIDGWPLDRVIRQLHDAAEPGATGGGRRVEPAPRVSPASNSAATTAPAARGSTLARIASGTLRRDEYYRTVARLGMEAAEALDAAHQEGVIHRDVKPSNLLLDRDGKLWVTDFGLARIQSEAALSRSGDVVGTWRYMSPEQARGESALVDHRTDIYSLGVTLWELLALEPAYRDEDRAALLRQFDDGAPPPLAPRCPGLPRDLETVVLKAMARPREERYASAREFADDLRRVLDGKPTAARPPTLADRLTRIAKRHRRWVVASVGVLAAIAAISTVAVIVTVRERLRAEENFARAERNYRSARQIVDRFGGQLAERLADVPGAEAVRRELLRETLGYYQHFVLQAGDDPELDADIALTFSKIGALAVEFGGLDEALDANQQATRRFNQLLIAQPKSRELRLAACIAQRQLADTLLRVDEPDGARRAGLESQRLLRLLLVEFEDDTEVAGELALTLRQRALIEAAEGQLDSARELLTEGVRLAKRLVEQSPSDLDARRRLALSLNELGKLFVDRRPAESLALHQQALRQFADQEGGVPETGEGGRRFPADLANTYDRLATAYERLDRWDAAIDAHERSIAIRRPLADRLPEARRRWALTQHALARALARTGQTADALEAFRKAIEVQEAVVAAEPKNAAAHSELGGMWNNLGLFQRQLGAGGEAVKSLKRAVDAQRQAFDGGRQVDRYRQRLSQHYVNLGRLLRDQGEFAEAVRIALERKQLWLGDGKRLEGVAREIEQICEAAKMKNSVAERTLSEYKALAADILTQARAIQASDPAVGAGEGSGIVLPSDEADATVDRDLSVPR